MVTKFCIFFFSIVPTHPLVEFVNKRLLRISQTGKVCCCFYFQLFLLTSFFTHLFVYLHTSVSTCHFFTCLFFCSSLLLLISSFTFQFLASSHLFRFSSSLLFLVSSFPRHFFHIPLLIHLFFYSPILFLLSSILHFFPSSLLLLITSFLCLIFYLPLLLLISSSAQLFIRSSLRLLTTFILVFSFTHPFF